MAATGVFTNAYRALLATRADSGCAGNAPLLAYFKIGCAGLATGQATPVPSAAYADLQANGGLACPLPTPLPRGSETLTPALVGPKWYYVKALAGGDISAAGNVLQVTCALGAAEANDDGTGGSPHLYELGIFDTAHVMIAYVTFTEATKTVGHTITRTVTITF